MNASSSYKYNAFMSYSHAADGKLAPALQTALHQFTKPWYRLRAMRVFRDKTSLAMTPELWPSIQGALSESEYFLLLASPQAAQSPWVQKEVDWWLDHRTAQTLFLVLTEGEAVWDASAGDFNWTKTNALPAVLEGKFKDEPLYVDLRWAKLVANLSLRHSQFRPAVLDISSTLLGRPKDELDGEDVQQHRRFRTITRLVIVALTLLTFLLTVGIIGVVLQTREIAHQASLVLATAAQNASDSGHFDRALRFATLATKDTWLSPTSLEAAPQLARAAHASAIQAILIHEGSVTSAAFSPDSTKIVTASADQTARVWDATTKKELARFSFTYRDAVMSVAFSPDSTKIVTASKDKTARIWDATTKEELARFTHGGFIRSATFNPDNTKIVTASDDHTARIWDVATGKELVRFAHDLPVVSATFSPDGTTVVTASWDNTARVWDVTTKKELARFTHGDAVMSVAFSPDSTKIVTASIDKIVRVWDVMAKRELARLFHMDAVMSAAFSPDSTKIITTSADRTARVWDVTTTLPLHLFFHEATVTSSAAFSPDSTKIVTASDDHTASIWDVATHKELARFAHDLPVVSVAFSPDSTKIITTSGDRTARVWDISWLTKHHGQELTDRVCREKLIGARHITFQDIKISPILSGRWEEDVCDPPSWFSRLAKNLGFGSKQTGNSN